MQVKDNPIMPGGWHYDQALNGEWVKVEAGDLKTLFENVMQFRIVHNIGVGDVMQEVTEQICSKHPKQCKGGGFIPPSFTVNDNNKKTGKISAWANGKLRQRRGMVGIEEAARRSKICKTCPFSIKWENECQSCVTNTKYLLVMLRNNQETESCGFCQIHEWDNETASFLTDNEKKPTQPAHCWV